VRREVAEIERLCAEYANVITALDWRRIEANIADTRRTVHALQNAMHDATAVRDEAFDRAVAARMERVHAFRSAHLASMQAYRDDVAARIQTISRWKTYARAVVGTAARPQRGRLFEDQR